MNEVLKDDNWFMWGLQQPWFAWGIALLILFPLAIVVLGEVLGFLDHRGSGYSNTLKNLRHLVLPQLVFLLLLTRVFEFDATSYLVKIVETLLYVFILHTALNLVNAVLFNDGQGQNSWQAKVPKLVTDIARIVLVVLGTAIVLSHVWGFELGKLIAALGVGSIVLGLALQDTLGSLFSGFALLSSKQFRVGDWLQAGDLEGKVLTMNWRTVTLLTRDEDIIIVPNSDLAKSSFTNFSHPYPRHMERVLFDLSFEDAPHKVKRVLTQAALDTPGVLTEPPPNVALISYDEFSVKHEVQYFIEDYADQPKVRNAFISRVWYVAKREGISFPTRAHEVFMYHPERQIKRSEAEICLEHLQATPFLRDKIDVVKNMADHARRLSYGRFEKIISQGDAPYHLYIVLEGAADEVYAEADGTLHTLNRLETGEFFGITEMVRNEPSPVSVIAADDMEVIAIDRDATHRLFEHYPDFATEMSQLVSNRQREVRNIRRKHVELLSDQLDGDPLAETGETNILPLSALLRKKSQS